MPGAMEEVVAVSGLEILRTNFSVGQQEKRTECRWEGGSGSRRTYCRHEGTREQKMKDDSKGWGLGDLDLWFSRRSKKIWEER